MNRRMICTCLMIVSIVLLVATGADAEELTDASEQWTYVLEDGAATITGCAEEPTGDLVIPGDLDGYPITGIGEYAFADYPGITSVTIPDSVKSIGDWAFARCDGITGVTIGDSVTSIGGMAFMDCANLTNVTIGSSVTSIGGHAFSQCVGLSSVTIPDSVTSIGRYAFQNCGLTGIAIPDSVTSIGTGAFNRCWRLTSMTIPESVTDIGSNPFSGCPLEFISISADNPTYAQIDGVLFDTQQKKLVSYPTARQGAYAIPEGVLLIGDWAFTACIGLTGVTIPDSITGIGYEAFAYCRGLTSVMIPAGVTSIGDSAFFECSGLTELLITEGVVSISRSAFIRCKSLTDVTIPSSVTSIGDSAFYGCEGITRVTVPDSVTSIGTKAFYECDQLTLAVTKGSYAEQYAKENDLHYIFTEPDGAYAEPPYDEKVTLVNNQTVNIRNGPGTQFQQIGEAYPGASFYFTGVVENDFYQILYPDIKNNPKYDTTADVSPEALSTIAYVIRSLADVSPVNPEESILSSLVGNLKLKPRAQIYLDAALSKEAKGAFGDENCVPFAGIAPNGAYAVLFERVNSKGEQVLWIGFVSPDDVNGETPLFEVEAAIEDEEDSDWVVRTDASGQWKYIPTDSGAMVVGYYEYPTGDLVIPGELDGHAVTSVGGEIFLYCENLKSVVIPEGVTSIGDEAFAGCVGLTSVTVPNSVTSIGKKAFEMCRRLTSVNIPEGVTTIEEETFFACGLTSVMIPSSVTSIVNNPFVGCPLKNIGVSSRNQAYEQVDGVLYDRREKMLVSYPTARKGAYEIPDGVLRIGSDAFRYCSDLTGITIPESVTAIGTMAFNLCDNLPSVAIPGSVTSIGESAFSACDGLTSLVIQDGVTGIGKSAFAWCGLTHVVIPDSVTSIGDSAFLECAALTSVTIPDSVTEIGKDAFSKRASWRGSTAAQRYEGFALVVAEGSYAEQYAKDNGITYTIAE